MLVAQVIVLAVGIAEQQAESGSSVEAVRAALQTRSSLTLTIPPPPVDPLPKRLGFITLEPPDANGQIIKVAIPIGDAAARATRAFVAARRRQAIEKARDEVLRALREFQVANPEKQ